MPSNIDKEFIENLQNFTESLEGIVELMKQQAEKGDAINQMLSAMDGPKMSDIAEDIKTLVEKTDKIDSRTKEILEEVRAARKEKESGVFGKVSDTKNRGKIVSGIEVIMLIAGGVLAIGLAFKMIGHVDILSVLALGVAIYAVSKAFAEIASIKELTPKKALLAGLVMVAMAGALVASSLILKYMQPIDIFTGFSMVLVGGALGLASLLLMNSIGKMNLDKKAIASILLLPLILPLMATAIVASSFIIKYMQPIDLVQGLSFALLGAALGVAALLLLTSVSKMDITPKTMLSVMLLPVILPIIASAIVLSSIVLQYFQPLKMDPLKFIGHSLSMGLGIAAFLPTFLIVAKLKLNPASLMMAGLGILIAASAVMLSSWILSVGNYDKYPSAKWAFGAGLSLILFTPSLVVFGILAMTGIGLAALALGAIGAVITAGTIVAVSHILNKGNFEGGPNLEWATSAGLILPIFGASMVAVALIPFAGKLLERGGRLVKIVANTIVDVADILREGNFTGGPTKLWAEGIGMSLGAFSSALDVAINAGGGGLFSKSKISPEDFVTFIKNVSHGMIAAADILKEGDWTTKAPTKEWGEGVGKGLQPFIDIFSMISNSPKAKDIMKDLIKSKGSEDGNMFTYFMTEVAKSMVKVNGIFMGVDWKGYPDKNWSEGVKEAFDTISLIGGADDSIIDGIDNFANAIKELSRSFNGLRESGLDKLGKLTASVTILSAVDQKQLNDVIGVLNANKEKLGNVTKEAGKAGPLQQNLRNTQEKVQKLSNISKQNELSNGEKMLSSKFDEVLGKFDEVLENMIKSGQGKDAGETDKVGSR